MIYTILTSTESTEHIIWHDHPCLSEILQVLSCSYLGLVSFTALRKMCHPTFVFVSKAPAKRSQHANATYRNIGGNMLRALGHRVAMSCDMLGVVGSSLKMVKSEPTTPNTSQHVAIGRPNAHNILRPTMLRYDVRYI